MMPILVFAMMFVTLYFLFFLALGAIFKKRKSISIRLERLAKEDNRIQDNELNKPFYSRIVKPTIEEISNLIMKITPKEIIAAYEKKVITAGNPFNLLVKDWINIQALVIVCLPVITVALGYYNETPFKNMFLFILAEIGLGAVLPSFILGKNASARQKLISNSLPDVLDLLTVSVEAGLGFDGALVKVVDKMPGPLSKEFENVIQEMKVGKSKKDSLKNMAERVGIPDLSSFVGSIIQADQLGIGIGNVLRIQSEQIRQKRMQRAQEKAMKAPVKMLIPMILFIFPTIFSVLLGPIVVRMYEQFHK